jgi:hypothetical protein
MSFNLSVALRNSIVHTVSTGTATNRYVDVIQSILVVLVRGTLASLLIFCRISRTTFWVVLAVGISKFVLSHYLPSAKKASEFNGHKGSTIPNNGIVPFPGMDCMYDLCLDFCHVPPVRLPRTRSMYRLHSPSRLLIGL